MTQRRDIHSDSLSDRMARQEEGLESLRTEFHSMGETVRGLARDVSHSITELKDEISQSGKSNWGTYWSGLGVLMLFVVTVGSGALAPLWIFANQNRNEILERKAAVLALQESVHEHQLSDGHPVALQKHIEAARRFAAMDATIVERVAELERKTHNETVLNNDRLRDRLQSLDDKLQNGITGVREARQENAKDAQHRELIETLQKSKEQP